MRERAKSTREHKAGRGLSMRERKIAKHERELGVRERQG